MTGDITKKFLFLIDGLDELEEYPEAIVNLLMKSTMRDNVKIVTSSRPLPGFQNAFEGQPGLMLDSMTHSDIQAFVLHLFNQSDNLAKIRTQQSDNKLETNMIGDIVSKASGDFLWASLSTTHLLQEITESDNLYSLQSRVEGFPLELDTLLLYIYQGLNDNDRVQASHIFRLVLAHGYPSLLGLSYANDPEQTSGISAEIRPLKAAELAKRVETISTVLRVQCRNFLTVFQGSANVAEDDEESGSNNDPSRLMVNWVHRCIRDSVQSGAIWEQIRQATGYDSFDPNEYWANASLWNLKTIQAQPSATGEQVLPIWETLAWCIEYALRLEEKDKKVRVTYLDEVGRAGIARKDLIKDNATDLPEGATTESFLDIAVWLNLSGYVSIKAKTADRKELRHAVEYYRIMRKRLGTGGEDRWLGNRKRMRVMYDGTSAELFQLLEYYGKAMRFATPKPHVDIPEGV
jgi:hypothetical protein